MIEYLNLEDVAIQRGEKSDLLARNLVANGSYLYLWFNNNRKHKAMMCFLESQIKKWIMSLIKVHTH